MARKVITMRAECRCGHRVGWIETKSGQNVVRCMACEQYQYCAPKAETGEEPRTVRREPIPPGLRWEVAERARGHCEICGTADSPAFHVGHLLSYADGTAAGFTDKELLHLDNLVWLCEECNLGNLRGSVHPVFWLAIVRKRMGR